MNEKKGFNVVKEKYEFMAENSSLFHREKNAFSASPKPTGEPLSSRENVLKVSPKPTGEPSQRGTGGGFAAAQKPGAQAKGQTGFGYPWKEAILPESYGQELLSLIPTNNRNNGNTQWLLYVTNLAVYNHIIEHIEP